MTSTETSNATATIENTEIPTETATIMPTATTIFTPTATVTPAVSCPDQYGIYDDRCPQLIYTGDWYTTEVPEARYETLTISQTSGSQIQFNFTGTRVSFLYTRAAGHGYYMINIDGSNIKLLHNDFPNTEYQASWGSSLLADGPHTLTLTNYLGGIIDIDAIGVMGAESPTMTPTITPTATATPVASCPDQYGIYDDRCPQLIYTGDWYTAEVPEARYETLTKSQTSGSQIQFNFTGTRVSFLYTRAAGHGYYMINIDGSNVKLLHNDFPNTEYQASWGSSLLADGPHTLTLTNYLGGIIDIDAIGVSGTEQ